MDKIENIYNFIQEKRIKIDAIRRHCHKNVTRHKANVQTNTLTTKVRNLAP